eukprot:4850969-Amphidinium_carterae.1
MMLELLERFSLKLLFNSDRVTCTVLNECGRQTGEVRKQHKLSYLKQLKKKKEPVLLERPLVLAPLEDLLPLFSCSSLAETALQSNCLSPRQLVRTFPGLCCLRPRVPFPAFPAQSSERRRLS